MIDSIRINPHHFDGTNRKWKRWLMIGLLALLGLGCSRQPTSQPSGGAVISTPPQPVSLSTTGGRLPDWCQVYFSRVHAGDPEQAKSDPASMDRQLVKHLNRAQKSIDAALHELDSDPIAEALIEAHERGVQVRVMTETDYVEEISIEDLQDAGIPVKHDQRSGLMHNKFIILDGETVWTGSFNTTDNGAYKNNNNTILIQSGELAANFTAEFQEMFERGEFGKGSDPSLLHPVVKMADGTEIVTLFAPENEVAETIIGEIGEARQSIRFMAFSFTHDGIAEALLGKKDEISIQGVFETRGSDTPYSEYGRFREAGLDVHQDGNRYSLHQGMLRTQIWPAFGPKSNFRFGNTWSPTGSRLDPLENWFRPG